MKPDSTTAPVPWIYVHDELRAQEGKCTKHNTYIVVEHGVPVPELVEVEERVVRAEVLELHEQLRERDAHLVHELFHELGHDLGCYALVARAEVEGVVEELLGVGAEVEADGEGGLGADTMGVCVGMRGWEDDWRAAYPAPATYKLSLPMLIGIPLTPRSPRPRIREPVKPR